MASLFRALVRVVRAGNMASGQLGTAANPLLRLVLHHDGGALVDVVAHDIQAQIRDSNWWGVTDWTEATFRQCVVQNFARLASEANEAFPDLHVQVQQEYWFGRAKRVDLVVHVFSTTRDADDTMDVRRVLAAACIELKYKWFDDLAVPAYRSKSPDKFAFTKKHWFDMLGPDGMRVWFRNADRFIIENDAGQTDLMLTVWKGARPLRGKHQSVYDVLRSTAKGQLKDYMARLQKELEDAGAIDTQPTGAVWCMGLNRVFALTVDRTARENSDDALADALGKLSLADASACE